MIRWSCKKINKLTWLAMAVLAAVAFWRVEDVSAATGAAMAGDAGSLSGDTVSEPDSEYDDEVMFSYVDRELVEISEDIEWHDRTEEFKSADGRKIKCVLKDKQVTVSVDGKDFWRSGNDFFVQDMIVGDIDVNDGQNYGVDNAKSAGNSGAKSAGKSGAKSGGENGAADKELVLLLWKEGRYGPHHPFWVLEDEKDYSQHIFVYNLNTDKITEKWGSSYMGEEATGLAFKEGVLFLKHNNNPDMSKKPDSSVAGAINNKSDTEINNEIVNPSESYNNAPENNMVSESAWIWKGFGFERLEDVKIVAAGDNLIHGFIYEDIARYHDGDFSCLYEKMIEYTKDADLSVINFETPVIKDASKYSTYPVFGGPVAIVEGVKYGGFDAVTLSNNHRFDKGAVGIDDTIEALEDNGLMHVGCMDDKPYLLVKRNNIIIALMSYTYGTNGIRPPKGYENGVNYLDDEEKVRRDIREAKENSDFVIVFPHWGTEYRIEPDSYQIKWRNIFYEEGVDVVVGTHPHIYEKYEMYSSAKSAITDNKNDIINNNAGAEESGDSSPKNMLIYYSLGNYISANGFAGHNSGGLAIFTIGLTSDGAAVTSYSFEEIDSYYKRSKYIN